jgi:hypothetical protein
MMPATEIENISEIIGIFERSMGDCGGSGGIRTHGTVPRTLVFKTRALNHSATLPAFAVTNGMLLILEAKNQCSENRRPRVLKALKRDGATLWCSQREQKAPKRAQRHIRITIGAT